MTTEYTSELPEALIVGQTSSSVMKSAIAKMKVDHNTKLDELTKVHDAAVRTANISTTSVNRSNYKVTVIVQDVKGETVTEESGMIPLESVRSTGQSLINKMHRELPAHELHRKADAARSEQARIKQLVKNEVARYRRENIKAEHALVGQLRFEDTQRGKINDGTVDNFGREAKHDGTLETAMRNYRKQVVADEADREQFAANLGQKVKKDTARERVAPEADEFALLTRGTSMDKVTGGQSTTIGGDEVEVTHANPAAIEALKSTIPNK